MKIAFTIVTIDFFPNAISLGDSITKHNPEYQFIIGMVDKREAFPDMQFSSKYPIIEIEEVNVPDFQERYERYNIFELVCSLRPVFAEYIAHKYEASTLLYFDSDMLVFNKLSYVEEILETNAIALTPHTCHHIGQEDSRLPAEEQILLRVGVINSGFFGLNMTRKSSNAFLLFWKEQLEYDCLADFDRGLFLDQKCLDLSLIFFEDLHIIRHLGYNMAHYNLRERKLNLRDKEYYVNDQDPLVIYHYSGYNWKDTSIISKYQNRFTLQQREDLKEVLELYSEQLIANDISQYYSLKSYYSKTPIPRVTPFEKISELEKELSFSKIKLTDQQNRIQNQIGEISTLSILKNQSEQELEIIKSSKFWKVTEKYWRLKSWLFNK